MKLLMLSEWERLWNRKITWLCFAFILPVLLATARYYSGRNEVLSPSDVEFSTVAKFPVLALAEQLMTVFNLVVLLLLVFSVTEEYRTGQLRMVMIRSYSFAQLFFAKWLTVLGTLLLFHVTYFIGSYGVGNLFFPSSEEVRLFLHSTPSTSREALLYNVQFYAIAYLTLVAMSCVVLFFTVISSTTTTAIGMTIGFLLVSIVYPTFFRIFTYGLEPPPSPKWSFLSLTQIQFEGIAALLAEKPNPTLVGFVLAMLFIYLLVFGIAAYLLFIKKDRFI